MILLADLGVGDLEPQTLGLGESGVLRDQLLEICRSTPSCPQELLADLTAGLHPVVVELLQVDAPELHHGDLVVAHAASTFSGNAAVPPPPIRPTPGMKITKRQDDQGQGST